MGIDEIVRYLKMIYQSIPVVEAIDLIRKELNRLGMKKAIGSGLVFYLAILFVCQN